MAKPSTVVIGRGGLVFLFSGTFWKAPPAAGNEIPADNPGSSVSARAIRPAAPALPCGSLPGAEQLWAATSDRGGGGRQRMALLGHRPQSPEPWRGLAQIIRRPPRCRFSIKAAPAQTGACEHHMRLAANRKRIDWRFQFARTLLAAAKLVEVRKAKWMYPSPLTLGCRLHGPTNSIVRRRNRRFANTVR